MTDRPERAPTEPASGAATDVSKDMVESTLPSPVIHAATSSSDSPVLDKIMVVT